MSDQRYSDNDVSKRDIPSFIEPRPPLIQNPLMRPRPVKGTNLLDLFEDSELEETEFPDLVQVYLRLKPCKVPNTLYEVRSDKCLVTSLDTATAGHGRRTQHNVSKMYSFSQIFGPDCKQKEIFESVVKDNLKKLPDGHSFTLLTYGASGSGKTYTLMGTVSAPGLVPRSLEYVFRLVDAAQQPSYKPTEGGADKLSYAEQDYELQWVKRLRHVSAPLREKYRRMSAQLHCELAASTTDLSNRIKHYVWVSFVEIYNEAIYDLLAPPEKRTKLRIREDSSGNAYVKDVTQAFVRSGEEAYDVMVAGKHNLVVAATGVHANSSRSHCIFTITMLTETESGSVRSSCVRLCDLAGSERARATRNTGARMAESRAINASLHVLERCLHSLRRKQRSRHDALVPYRESKLTRLLGSGLSGARGEAVSMVVTLNPSPEYAHESKHVLSLAAVAQDIQINNTVFFGSTLESSTQDTTIESSGEIMKLRSENERLHFELVQAHTRNKELMASMEETQLKAADTMREVVEEAKDMTRQYYESLIEALRAQMEEMTEDYESRLEQAKVTKESSTPSKVFQAKIAQLMMEIAVLEEKLTAESLARKRAEKELEHLHTCIEERDEKGTPVPEIMDVTVIEDDFDEEQDLVNESLEPTFRKEMDRSVAIHDKLNPDSYVNTISEEDLEKSNDTITNDDDNTEHSPNAIQVHESNANISKNNITSSRMSNVESFEEAQNEKSEIISEANNITFENNNPETSNIDTVSDESFKSTKSSEIRGTYFVKDTEIHQLNKKDEEINLKKINMFPGTYCVPNSVEDVKKTTSCNNVPSSKQNCQDSPISIDDIDSKVPQNIDIGGRSFVSNIGPLSNQGDDDSLREFELLEKASKEYREDTNKKETFFNNIRTKKTYFDDIVSTNKNLKTVPDDFSDIKLNNEEHSIFEYKEFKMKSTSNKDEKSPLKAKEVQEILLEPNSTKKSIGQCDKISKPDVLSHQKNKMFKKHDSVDIFDGFDSPAVKIQEKAETVVDNIEIARASIAQLVLDQQSKKSKTNELKSYIEQHMLTEPVTSADKVLEEPKLNDEIQKSKPVDKSKETLLQSKETLKDTLPLKDEFNDCLKNKTNPDPMPSVEDPQEITVKTEIKIEQPSMEESNLAMNETQNFTKTYNTTDEFETIYQDLTAPRATEFELLVSHNNNESNNKVDMNNEEKHDKPNEITECGIEQYMNNLVEEIDTKMQEADKEETKYNLRNKREATTTKKRSLRLRRRKNENDDDTSQERTEINKQSKLKDIGNLQSEFSDVTMDLPATKKKVQDIPSPEKCENENLPPILGIQSCPSKSVTRSRRKLFTPCAEPLEESLAQTGDSNERLYVPRPSYHRPRARRKL